MAATAAVLATLAAAAPAAPGAGCSRVVAHDPSVPRWETVNGFALGSRPATAEEIDGYVAAVDRASPRVRAGVAGRSLLGRPLTYALVSQPRDLSAARLSTLSRSLRAHRPRGPAVVWLAAGAHGDEPSGPDADMRILYDLASRTDCANEARLRRLMTVLLPLQNPDGRAAATRDSAAGFDLNRDWFASTQPETATRLALMRRFPPVLLADQHEQDGTDFTFPPNADPVHHEISRESLAAINDVAAGALRRAFTAHGIPHATGGPYDLFFMGYADTASTTMLGAGGMTFEQGRDSPFGEKVARHVLAAGALLDTAARNRGRLLRGWVRHWRTARRQGAEGRLEPNLVLNPAIGVSFPVPRARVRAYALRADRHAADALALVARLRGAGVAVRRLRTAWRTRALDPYGRRGPGPATLPAGTFVVPMRQDAKHWVQAMLGEDAHVPFPYFYDASAWSNPLLMGVGGGAIGVRVPPRLMRAVSASDLRGGPAPPAGARVYGFAGDSEGALGLAGALLAQGAAVRRAPGSGAFTVEDAGGHATLARLAAERRVPLRAVAAAPPGAVLLRRPRVAVLTGGTSRSGSWSRHVIERRLGLPADPVAGAEVAAGRLTAGEHTALVAPDGSGQDLGAAGLAAIRTWVRSGGTLIGIRGAGIAIAQAAGLTAATQRPPPPGLRVPGALLGVVVDATDPIGWGTGGAGFAFNDTDPVIEAGGARVVARYPGGRGFFVSGYAEGTTALHGTAAVTHERADAGHVVLFAFDPAYRGYAEGTQRLLANAILVPDAGGSVARARPVEPALLAAAPAPARDSLVTVAAAGEQHLLAAAAEARVPSTRRVHRDLLTSTLVVRAAPTADPRESRWPRRLLRALSDAGVRPLYAAF